MGDLGRPQMFSPMRRSSLYLAECRFDMVWFVLSLRRGPAPRENGGTIATAATRHPSWCLAPVGQRPGRRSARFWTRRRPKSRIAGARRSPFSAACPENFVANALEVLEHRIAAKPENSQTAITEVGRALQVVFDSAPLMVLGTVQFDHECCVGAVEVNDIGPQRDLPLPLPTTKTAISQFAPKASFGIGLRDPELTGAIEILAPGHCCNLNL